MNSSDWISRIDRHIHQFAILYKTQFQSNLKPVLKELTPIELGILNLIEWDPEISFKKIAAFMGAPGSTVTSAVNRLEKRGILIRAIHPRDKRSFMLHLTEPGRELVRYRNEVKEHMLGALYNALEDEESREALLHLLDRAFDNLSNRLDPETEQ